MTKKVEIELAGARRGLIFNNYAIAELSKALGIGDHNPAKLIEKIDEIIKKENHMLLLKMLVYAGHCGDCYCRQNHPDLSYEEIGSLIGDADESELYQVWKSFTEVLG